jgi:hypothetical protein
MNEKLYKLLQESKVSISSPRLFHGEIDIQKFAELIIQECLNICEDMGDNGKDGHYCADKITKTFFR